MFCSKCGKKLDNHTKFCDGCGSPTDAIQNEVEASCEVNFERGQVSKKNVHASELHKNNNDIPDGVKGWSWGAFLGGPIWAVGNKTWIGLLAFIPYVGIIMYFVLGFKGREWAWKNKKWNSVEQFNAVQRAWSKWMLIIVAVCVTVGIGAAVGIPAYDDYQGKTKISAAISSFDTAKVFLGNRMSGPLGSTMLSQDEFDKTAELQNSNSSISKIYYYSIGEYSDIVADVKINKDEGKIYTYTKDAGKTWLCGFEVLPNKYFSSSCQDDVGIIRPEPPKVESKDLTSEDTKIVQWADYIGKRSYEILENHTVEVKIKKMLKDEFNAFQKNIDVAEIIYATDDNLIVGSGIAQHSGGIDEAIFAIDTTSNAYYVVLLSDGKYFKAFGVSDMKELPDPLREWMTEKGYQFD